MNLRQKFYKEILAKLKKDLWKENDFEVPKLDKLVINVWVWSYLQNWSWRSVDDVVDNITKISWQRPVIVKSKIAVSNFKLRKWMSNWVRVTLRWDVMYNFVEKLVHIALPRVRDFKWVSKKAFDKNWNYTLWISDVTIFPEISLEDISKTHWLQLNFSTSASNKEEAWELLKNLGLPFQK